MRNKDTFKDYIDSLLPREPSSAQPAVKRSAVKTLSIKMPILKEQGSNDVSLNFTFSPTKKQGPPEILNELKCFRSESCGGSRNDQKRGDSRDRVLRAVSPARGRKQNFQPGKLNKIKVLSPIPNNNETNCFSPQIMRKIKEIPFSVFDVDHPTLLESENKPEILYPKFNYYSKKLSLNPTNLHNTSMTKNEQQPLSPLQFSAGRPPVYIRDDLRDSQPSPTYLKGDDRLKKLPLIDLSRKGNPNPLKPVIGHYKLQNVEERWTSLQRKRPSIPFVNLTNKSGINNSNKFSFDESPSIIADRVEPGGDSQRANGLRFRAEEMILNKLFKPLN